MSTCLFNCYWLAVISFIDDRLFFLLTDPFGYDKNDLVSAFTWFLFHCAFGHHPESLSAFRGHYGIPYIVVVFRQASTPSSGLSDGDGDGDAHISISVPSSECVCRSDLTEKLASFTEHGPFH